MTLSPQWLDELRSRITLSTLIGRHVKVQRAGREYKACCPFHNEKTPSFTINDDKGFYHCFGCGAHGDAIRFMTDHQGLVNSRCRLTPSGMLLQPTRLTLHGLDARLTC